MIWIAAILREPINGMTHIIAALLAIFGVVHLMRASIKETVWHRVSFAIYGISLIALYTMSALLHSLTTSPETIDLFRRLDQAMIYALIAGTYTPICLTVLRGGWGWSLLIINWGLAATFIPLKIVLIDPPEGFIVTGFVFFIVMGWLIVVAWRPMVRALPRAGILWLLLGGILYTAGSGVLNIKGVNIAPGFGPHETWHLFVMAASFCHYWFMFKYVMRAGSSA